MITRLLEIRIPTEPLADGTEVIFVRAEKNLKTKYEIRVQTASGSFVQCGAPPHILQENESAAGTWVEDRLI